MSHDDLVAVALCGLGPTAACCLSLGVRWGRALGRDEARAAHDAAELARRADERRAARAEAEAKAKRPALRLVWGRGRG